jgi:hypothetical protein
MHPRKLVKLNYEVIIGVGVHIERSRCSIMLPLEMERCILGNNPPLLGLF